MKALALLLVGIALSTVNALAGLSYVTQAVPGDGPVVSQTWTITVPSAAQVDSVGTQTQVIEKPVIVRSPNPNPNQPPIDIVVGYTRYWMGLGVASINSVNGGTRYTMQTTPYSLTQVAQTNNSIAAGNYTLLHLAQNGVIVRTIISW